MRITQVWELGLVQEPKTHPPDFTDTMYIHVLLSSIICFSVIMSPFSGFSACHPGSGGDIH